MCRQRMSLASPRRVQWAVVLPLRHGPLLQRKLPRELSDSLPADTWGEDAGGERTEGLSAGTGQVRVLTGRGCRPHQTPQHSSESLGPH